MDPNVLKATVLIIFIGCYFLVISRKVRLAYVALTSAALALLALVPVGAMTPGEAFNTVDWSVLGVYWGFLMLSIAFSKSGFPEHLAEHILHRTKNEGRALLALCGLTALMSSFLENVGTVLIMAPIAFEIAKRTKSSPFIHIVSVAVSANMVTTVTMIADPPSLILASETGMNFLDFFWFQGRIGLGVISALGVLTGLATLYLIHFRRMTKKVGITEKKIRIDYIPAAIFLGGILMLAINSFIGIEIGIIGLTVGVLAILTCRKGRMSMIRDFDWNSFLFIFGIFIVIGTVQKVGILQDFAGAILSVGLNNPVVTLALLTWVSVALSSFIDNVPYTVLMIPVCTSLAGAMGVSAFPFLFGMMIGTGIGGNITPVGATANVFAVGMLEKRGHKIKLKEYLKVSLLASIVPVLVSYVLLQLIWL